MEAIQQIEKRKIVPIAAMVSAGKSKILNILYNIKFLESKPGISTKFVNLLRYNPNIEQPRFYHLKLIKEGNDYNFYKDLNSEEIIGEQKIIEENININNELRAKLKTNYEDIFYMTEINDAPFIKDKNYLLNHDLCDIPGLSEYQATYENDDNSHKINVNNEQQNLEEIIKEGEEEYGIFANLKLLQEEGNNNIINNEIENKDKNKNEDDIFYEFDIEKENSYLTEIFNIIKNYIDGAIIVLSIDKYYFRENFELIAKLHKVTQKNINNFLIILNKMDLSLDPQKDIEKCKGLFIKYFPKCKTFNINLNTFIPISSIQFQNELLMSKEFKYLINYHYFNYINKLKEQNHLKSTPLDQSFINHLMDILKINDINTNIIESEVKKLNQSENIEKINNEIISIINDLKQYFKENEINIGITEEDFKERKNEDEDNLLDDDEDNDTNRGETTDGNDKKNNPSFIIKMLYILYKQNKLIPSISEESEKLLNYFTTKKKFEQKKEETKGIINIGEETKINMKLINSLEILYNSFKESKIDIIEINDLVNEILKTITYLKNSDIIHIPFLGPSNSGKTTLINGIIGKNILPIDMNECTKRGIIIKYSYNDEITIRKANFKEETIFGNKFYHFEPDNIIGKGIDQVQETLNGLNYDFPNKKEDFFYYITTKIKLFDDLGFDDNYKNSIYLIDFPGYGTNNIFEKEIYNKIMSICNCFIFVVRNSIIKEKKTQKILNSLFIQAKEQKKKSSSQFSNSCLFIFNNDKSQNMTKSDLELAKQDIKEIINGIDINNIKACFINAKYYSNFCSIMDYFFNLNNSLKKEFEKYNKTKKKIFINPELFKGKIHKSFCDYFKKVLTSKIKAEGFGNKITSSQKKDEKVENEINQIFERLNIHGDKNKDTIIKIISFARENINNLDYLKESNIKELNDIFSLQIYLFFYNMQETIKEKIDEITSILDLFFRKDIKQRENDLKKVADLKENIKKLKVELESEITSGTKKINDIIQTYKEKVLNSLKKKENNFINQLKSKNYKEIFEEINIEIKNNLEELIKKIIRFLDDCDLQALNIYSKTLTVIIDFSKTKINFPQLIRFKEQFSKVFGNKEKDLAEEIFKEIKISNNSLNLVFKEKGFTKWLSSLFSNYKYLINISEIVLNTFINKIEYILRTMNEEYSRYINNLIDTINIITNSTTIQFTEEQEKTWDELNDLYKDIRSNMIDIKLEINDSHKY